MRTRGGQELAARGSRPFIWMAIVAILLAPLVAMHFTPAVHWTAFDFAVAGGLLVGAMATYEIAARFVRTRVADDARRGARPHRAAAVGRRGGGHILSPFGPFIPIRTNGP